MLLDDNKMNYKWYKFLLIEERNKREIVYNNFHTIYDSLSQIVTQNSTANILDKIEPREFGMFLEKNNLLKIFETYKIDGLLGYGAMGMAFSLKDPHENYVLKFEMHYHKPVETGLEHPGGLGQATAFVKKRHGVDYPQQIAAKQEKGEYDPKQVNVLESEAVEGKTIILDAGGGQDSKETIDFYLSVMSRVQTSGYAGKGSKNKWAGLYKNDPRYEGGMTIRQAMQDFAFSKAPVFISMAIEKNSHSNPDLKNWIRGELQFSKFGSGLPRDNEKTLSKITDILYDKILIQDGKGIANFLYNTFQDQFQFLSKEQFVDLCREFYERLADAKRSGKAFADFHGGNVGIGPKGFASFDV